VTITWATTGDAAGVARFVANTGQCEAVVLLLAGAKSIEDARAIFVAKGMTGLLPPNAEQAVSQGPRPCEIIVLRDIAIYNNRALMTVIHNFSRAFFASERSDAKFQKMLSARGAVQVNNFREHLGLTAAENEFALSLSERLGTEMEKEYRRQKDGQKLRPVIFSATAGMILISSQMLEALYSRKVEKEAPPSSDNGCPNWSINLHQVPRRSARSRRRLLPHCCKW